MSSSQGTYLKPSTYCPQSGRLLIKTSGVAESGLRHHYSQLWTYFFLPSMNLNQPTVTTCVSKTIQQNDAAAVAAAGVNFGDWFWKSLNQKKCAVSSAKWMRFWKSSVAPRYPVQCLRHM